MSDYCLAAGGVYVLYISCQMEYPNLGQRRRGFYYLEEIKSSSKALTLAPDKSAIGSVRSIR